MATPASQTLTAGPIDCRISPTAANKLATPKPIEWFRKNLISTVPRRHGGGGRRVYPGFVQLSAFISMNKDRHVNAFKEHYQHLVADEFARPRRAVLRKHRRRPWRRGPTTRSVRT